jgi:Protein of unknown function (DUF2924)
MIFRSAHFRPVEANGVPSEPSERRALRAIEERLLIMINSFCGANPTIPATACRRARGHRSPSSGGSSQGPHARSRVGRHLHRVMAIDGGSVWDGETYRSLSHLARAIPGVRWNGPRFLGLPGSPGIGRRDCMRGPAYTR